MPWGCLLGRALSHNVRPVFLASDKSVMAPIFQRIADELGVKAGQVSAAVGLLDEGATVPFISRYRKEVTGGLDDSQLRTLETRLAYLREMEDRRQAILESIEEQGKLTPQLKADIEAADTKTRLEDLYLPYKKKRRTKGQMAIEAGIEPLAELLYANPERSPESEAEAYLNADAGFADVKAVLEGARYILMERFAENAELLSVLRDRLWDDGLLMSQVFDGKQAEGAKFSDYFEHCEPLKTVPSHRALAMFRARNEGVVALKLVLDKDESPLAEHPLESVVAQYSGVSDKGRAADRWLKEVVRWTWRIKLYTHLESDLFARLRERAESEAITVFASNLKDLLLAAPAGPKVTIGLDPGLRTGVKVAVVDATGKVLDHTAIYPHAPQNKIADAARVLVGFAEKYGVELVAIGNGTASRETERFVKDIAKARPELGLKPVVVNEAGASIYSASEYAAKEFPDLDVTIRGAISIARRLQDPLAELVKIEPKAIGVGQYQHDVSQLALSRSLEAVVEDCVNAVGVDVNMASPALLARVSGLNQSLAANIVDYRNQHGAFSDREALKSVPRFGDKTFEQAAGFLRIQGGANPLDGSAVHPESYPLVEKIVSVSGRPVGEVVGDAALLKSVNAQAFVDERFGLPTVKDVLAELAKPGRDPRPEFKTASFLDGVEKISDLKSGMILEGAVTNVTNFGAFVDIGVHQDGLVHISALSNQFVKDPREVVKAGDIVTVKVMSVDVERKRVGLSMRLDDEPESASAAAERGASRPGDRGNARSNVRKSGRGDGSGRGREEKAPLGGMAAAFAQAGLKRR